MERDSAMDEYRVLSSTGMEPGKKEQVWHQIQEQMYKSHPRRARFCRGSAAWQIGAATAAVLVVVAGLELGKGAYLNRRHNANHGTRTEATGVPPTTKSSPSNPVNVLTPFYVGPLQVKIINERMNEPNGTSWAGGMPPKSGYHWIQFAVDITNLGDTPITLKGSMFELSYLDVYSGYTQHLYPVSGRDSALLGNGLIGKTLLPGTTMKGVLPFQVPKNVTHGMSLKVTVGKHTAYGFGMA